MIIKEIINFFQDTTNDFCNIVKDIIRYPLVKLGVLTVVFGMIGSLYSGKTFFNALFKSVALFTLNFENRGDNIFSIVAGLLAIITISFGAITFYYSQIKEKKYLEEVMNDKYDLVCGLGENNRYFLDGIKVEERKKMLIVEQDKNNIHIDEYKKKGFAISIDDCLDDEFFKNLKFNNLDNIIISLGNDLKNIDCINNFIKILKDYNQKKQDLSDNKKVVIHIADKKLKLFFEKNIISTNITSYDNEILPLPLDIVVYSYYELAARELINKHGILGYQYEIITSDTNESFSIALIGDGHLALEVVYQICALAHFPNENKLTLYLLSQDAKKFYSMVKQEYKSIDKIENIIIKPQDFNIYESDKYNTEWLKSKNLTNVIIAYDDTSLNIDIAVELYDEKCKLEDLLKNTKFLISTYESFKLSSLINENDIEDELKHFFTFGEAKEIFNKEKLINEELDKLAKLIHYGYDDNLLDNKKLKPNEYNEKWCKLTNLFERDSNRAQAMHIDIKLMALGLKREKSKDSFEKLLEVNEKNLKKQLSEDGADEIYNKLEEYFKAIQNEQKKPEKERQWIKLDYFPEKFETKFEKIINSEHNRWCAFHHLHGWEYAPVKDCKDNEYKELKVKGKKAKKHNCLISFKDEFPEKEKYTIVYDIFSIIFIPKFLANIGYKITKID